MIFAIDFDGTLCENRFPEIGQPIPVVLDFVRDLEAQGHEWVLYTMREGELLEAALRWLKSNRLIPDAANNNLKKLQESWKNNPRKIYADAYIDDHGVGHLNFQVDFFRKKFNIKKGGLRVKHEQVTITLPQWQISVDKELAKLIEALNASGFKTLYSCQGDESTPAYVKFHSSCELAAALDFMQAFYADAEFSVEEVDKDRHTIRFFTEKA